MALALVLGGCGDLLDSRYGVTDRGSINGCAVLHRMLAERSDLHAAHQLNARLAEHGELLIHVAREEALPDEEACDWVSEWLSAEDHRQAVVVLRGGTLTAWLCRRWAAQARSEADQVPAQAAELRAQATILEQRATAEQDTGTGDRTLSCALFRLRQHASRLPTAVSGLGLSQVPKVMRVNGEVLHKKAQALISVLLPTSADADAGVEAGSASQPWAVTIPYGEDSRLVVVADALPLLDGAQPDPAARQLLGALVDAIITYHHGPPHATWVNHLQVAGDAEPPNPLLALLTTAPIAWITWHLIALLVVLALASAAWLGRREAPRDRRHDRFSRHVQALAGRLRDAGQVSWCARAIARVVLHHRGATPDLPDAAGARAWLHRTVTAKSASASPSALPRSAPRPP